MATAKKTKTNLTLAFAALRDAGLFARQNYKCCHGCAGAAAATAVTDLLDKGRARETVMGCVFYHGQDADDLRGGRDFYLAYGSVDTAKHGEVGLPTEDVGRLVVATLAKCGVETVWDGNPGTRILVRAASVRQVPA
jgi:hypothetical protein